jgi:hypothetical protein
MTIHRRARLVITALASALVLGLAACGEDDVERNVDEGAQEVKEAGKDAKKAGDDAAGEVEEGADDAQKEIEE